ncbi:MAG: recombinase family protein [Dehalococcoidia bacterium]
MRAIGFYHSRRSRASASQGGAVTSHLQQADPVEEIELYCRQNSHQLIGMFGGDEDGEAQAERYQRLVDSFTGPDARLALVIIPDSTHLAEDLETLVARLIDLYGLGAEVRCTDPDLPDPLQNGVEYLGIKGRSPGRQRRIREAIMAKASRGEVLGRTPYGYVAGVDGQLKPVPGEARVIQDVFEWYAGPEPKWREPAKGGIGLRTIAQRLNDQGLRTRRGHAWTQVSVAGILRNRTYLGTYARYGIRIVKSHQPIVDRSLFNRAQAVLESRRPARRPSAEEPYMLGGMVRCAVCGRGVFGMTRHRAWRRKDGTPMQRSYRYYECPSRPPRKARDQVESHPSWRADDLEDAVRAELRQWSDRAVASLAATMDDADVAGPEKGRIAAVEREFMRSVRAVSSGYGGIFDLRQPLSDLRQARASARSEPEAGLGDAGSALQLAIGGHPEAARKAIDSLVERIIVATDSVEVIPRRG